MEKIKKVVLREDLLAITGDFRKAIILKQFIYWSERVSDADKFIEKENEIARKNGEEEKELFYGWIYKTAEELSNEIMLGLSVSQVRRYINELVNMGFISKRNNPKYKWDRTLQYRVSLVNIAKALKEKGYPLSDYKINLPDDFSNAHECAMNEAPMNDQCDSNRQAIPEITNRDYISDINDKPDTTSSTELKEEEKNAYHSNEWFNSQHIKNMLTEESIQYTPIDRKSFNWSAFKNQVSVRIEELGYTTSPYTTNRFLVVSKYFFKRYEERTRKPHIKINQDALDNILDKFGFGPNPDYFQNVEIETYMKVIDEYFGTSFSEYTDHHYSHFMSGYIRKNLLMKVEDREDTL